MMQLVARALRGALLFRTWVEARALWDAMVGLPGLRGLTLMPDHLHALTDLDQRAPLYRAMSGFARWRNHHRGETGPVWERAPIPQPVPDRDKRSRSERYLALNPCRKGLSQDPLAWAFSTHRDWVGLALPAVVEKKRDVNRFHEYVSSDPTVHVQGSLLPVDPGAILTVAEVEWAVSSLTRTPLATLRRRGMARSLALRAARALTPAPVKEIAGHFGVTERTVLRTPPTADPAVRLVSRVAKDARFQPLPSGDLRGVWWPYRNFR